MPLIEATATVQIDTPRVRVTQWRLPPRSETGHHVHGFDYVVVPLTSGTLTIVEDDGTAVRSPLTPGRAYAREAGVSHNVTNLGEEEIVFIEVEIR